ncbi:Brp/Blh family beta-carotene 15,15'-dioxygenase [Sphingosinicellaceae bacterium]|nr:Brp/Blh family beta-carotene 15,15'-dioxygenase [Sphingosinicellaceae bacterium]
MIHATEPRRMASPPAELIESNFPGATAAIILATSVMMAAACGVPLSGSGPQFLACVAILVFGLPHGALDIEVIRRLAYNTSGTATIVAVYLGIAVLTALVWLAAPVVALAGFVVIAVFHFAEDWEAVESKFLATSIAAALMAAPTVVHHDSVAAIFVALTDAPAGAYLADGLLLAAPTLLAMAAVGVVAMTKGGHYAAAAAATASLAALITLPPVTGFAVFFCLFHSPRHFIAARRAAQRWRPWRWLPIVAPVTGAALAIVSGVYVLHGGLTVTQRLTAATFMALAILTVPHMLAPVVLKRRALGQRRRSQALAALGTRALR